MYLPTDTQQWLKLPDHQSIIDPLDFGVQCSLLGLLFSSHSHILIIKIIYLSEYSLSMSSSTAPLSRHPLWLNIFPGSKDVKWRLLIFTCTTDSSHKLYSWELYLFLCAVKKLQKLFLSFCFMLTVIRCWQVLWFLSWRSSGLQKQVRNIQSSFWLPQSCF